MGAQGSTLKRVRQSQKRNSRNRHYKSMMKTAIKNVLTADEKNISTLFNQAISTIDRVSDKGIIHKNRAAQHKSKLAKFINNI